MDTTFLETFLAVAERGSFTAAAHIRHLSQPAVSQQIAALEAEYGQRLFVRTSRQVTLTEAGRVLRHQARAALDHLHSAGLRMQALDKNLSGTLRLGAADTLTAHRLAVPLAAFMAEHPGLRVAIVNRPARTLRLLLDDGELDLALVTAPANPAKAHGRTEEVDSGEAQAGESLFTYRLKLALPLTHPLAQRRRVGLRALQDQRLLLLERGTATRSILDEHCRAQGVRLADTLDLGSVDIQLALAAAGMGLALIPDYVQWSQSNPASDEAQALHAIGVHHGPILQVLALLPSRYTASQPALALRGWLAARLA